MVGEGFRAILWRETDCRSKLLDLVSFPPEFLFLFSLSEKEKGFGAIFRCGADCRSKRPTPPNETSVPVFQLRPFVAETSFETSVNNDSLDLGEGRHHLST